MKSPAEKTGEELLLDGRDKGVSVDRVEGVLEVEGHENFTLVIEQSVPNSVHDVFCSARDAHAKLDKCKDSRGSSPFDVGS